MNNNSVTPSKNVSFKRMATKDLSNQKENENQTIILKNFDTDLEQLKQQPLGHEAFVKIGDIVILKFKNSSNTQEGFIQGDGIIQTKLDLIYQSEQLNGEMKINDVLRKNLKIQQCLFKIKVGKKYQVGGQSKSIKQFNSKRSQKVKQQKQNLSKRSSLQIYPIDGSDDSNESQDNQQGEQSNNLNKITAKLQEMEEVLENNDGTILTYGQEVQFFHLYSGSTLAINREAITQRETYNEIVLSNQGSIHSNFKIFKSDILRNQGNPIFYGQQLVIQTSTVPPYYLNIQESFAFSGFEEVSANSEPCYFSFQNYEQIHNQNRPRQVINFIKKKFQNGDVIYIKNKGSQSYLSIGKKKLDGSLAEVNKIIQKQIEVQNIYELKVEQQEEDINLKGLWLIEDVDFQQHHVFTTQSSFTLKHLLTGLYLKVDYRNEKYNLGFSLTKEKDTCIFNFSCQFQARALITDQDVFQIIHKNKKKNENQQDLVMLVENKSLWMKEISSDQDYGKYLFCFEISNKQDSRSVTTLNSIYFSLVNLLFLLQKEEKSLREQLKQQLSDALTQITSFLNEEQNVWMDREMKYRFILKADILMLIMVILNILLSDKASEQLVEGIVKINQMLKEIFSNNSNVCEFIMSKQSENDSPFSLLESFFNNRNFASDILQNIVFYSKQIPKDFFYQMIGTLDQINEQNVHFQTKIFKILSLTILDRNEKSRVKLQEISLKYLERNQKLFFKLDVEDEQIFFEFRSLSAKIDFEENNLQLFKFLEQKNQQKQINQGRVYLLLFMENHRLDEEQSKLVDIYEDYFASVLLFYSSICKSRNQETIRQIQQEFNLTPQNILLCLKHCYSTKFKLKLQSAFINLLVNLYLNADPIFEKSSLLNQDQYFLKYRKDTGEFLNIDYFSSSLKQFERISGYKNLMIKDYEDISTMYNDPLYLQEFDRVPFENLVEFFYNILNLIHAFCNIHSNQQINVATFLFQAFLNIMTKKKFNFQEIPNYLIQESLLNLKDSILPDKIMIKILLIFKIAKITAISPNEINKLLKSYLLSIPKCQNPYFNEMKNLLFIEKSNLDNQQNIIDCNSENFPNEIILAFNGESEQISLSITAAKKLIPKTIKFICRKIPFKGQKKYIYEQQFLQMNLYINQLLCFFEDKILQLDKKQNVFYKMNGLQILNDIFFELDSILDVNQDILIMYNNLIAIYYYLTKNNLIISQVLSHINYAKKLLSCLYINVDEKITIHKVFSNILYTNEFQYELIELIFKHVKQIGAELLMKHSFFSQHAQHQSSNQESSQQYVNYSCDILIKAAISCVKILSTTAKTIVPNKYRYLERQDFIISKILSSKFFCIAMTLKNYFTNQDDEIIHYLEPHLVDLHKSILYLSCYCCQNNSSAALILQRIILIDDINHTMFQRKYITYGMRQAYFKYMFTQLKQHNMKEAGISLYSSLMSLLKKQFGIIEEFCIKQEQNKEFKKFFSKNGIFSMSISYLSFFHMNNMSDENIQQCEQLFDLIDLFLDGFSFYQKNIPQEIKCNYKNYRMIYEDLRTNFPFQTTNVCQIENHFQAQLIQYDIDFEQFCFFYFTESQIDLKNFCSQLCNFQFNFNEARQKQLVKYIEQSSKFQFFKKQLEQKQKQVAASQLQLFQAHQEDKSQFIKIIQLFKNDKQLILSILSQQEELKNFYLLHQSEKLQFEKELKQSLNSFLINSKDMDIQFLHKVFQYYNQHNQIELQVNIGGFIRNNSSNQQAFIQLIRQQLISSQQDHWKEIVKFIYNLCYANKEFQDVFQIGYEEAISIQNIIINQLSLFLTNYQEEKRYLGEIIEGLIALQKLAARNSTICQEICQNQLFMDQLNKILSFQDMKIDEFYVQLVCSSEFTLIFQIVALFLVLINIEQPFQNIIYILSYVQNLQKLLKVFFQPRQDLNYPDVVFVDERCKEFIFYTFDQPERIVEINKLYSNLYTLFSYLKHHLKSMSIEQELSKRNINYFPSNWQSIQQSFLNQLNFMNNKILEVMFQIEILNENQKLETQFFHKPDYSDFLTIRIKQHILTHVERSNQYKRIQGLIQNFDTYSQQMQFLRNISNYKLMYLGLRNWRILKKITYFFYLLVVILFVAIYNEQQSVSLEQNLSNQLSENNLNEFYYIINSLVLFLNCIIFGFSFIERNKIIIADYEFYREQRIQQIQYQKFNTKLDFYFSDLNVTIFQFFSRMNNCFVKLLPVILNFENLYNILIISLVIYGYFNQYIYGILLLDIVSQSDDLQLIIQSVTLNGMNILRFAYLAVVGLLIYSFIAYSYFKSMFENENGIYASSLFQTITSTINLGLRSGGGIGDALGNYHNPNEDPTNYWSRYIYDVSFFIIFNMLFFQMLFGMIIETFGELRAEQQRIKQEINEKCVLCGISQGDADKYENNGWFYHIYVKHNLYNMLFYMMHIKNKQKEQDQSNILEKYIFECITNKDPAFFPIIDSELKQQFQEEFINK